jgi:RNA polymerase sigma-70 factor, ECF subfamily
LGRGKEMQFEEEIFIKQIKKRNEEALKQVMDMFMNSVYGIAKSILIGIATEEDIEECVQDVFVDVWKDIHKYDNKRGSLKTWILILCKYKALNIRKKSVKEIKPIDLEEMQLATSDKLEEEYMTLETKKEMLDAINCLNNIDRDIFLRRYLLDQDIDAICSIMELTRQAVDNRLWRGRKRLRDIIGSMEGRDING